VRNVALSERERESDEIGGVLIGRVRRKVSLARQRLIAMHCHARDRAVRHTHTHTRARLLLSTTASTYTVPLILCLIPTEN